MRYNKKFQQILNRLEKIDDEECQELKKEIQVLSDLYEKKDQRLNKIVKLSDTQQKAILELHEELDTYKKTLEEKVQNEINKRKQQEELLLERSRLAALAEMIDAVAHQWMQPLNIIWMQTELLHLDAKKNNGIDEKRVDTYKGMLSEQMNHLLDTLRNFRTFFRPVDEQKPFLLTEAVASVLTLVADELQKYSIEVELDTEKDFSVIGNVHEFKHILLNFINNSKYAFLANEVKERKVKISIDATRHILEYFDNAGGIDESVLDTLFDMHTSTKENEGTGIGLYMSQQIAKKHSGVLTAHNYQDGAKFVFHYNTQISKGGGNPWLSYAELNRF